MLLTLELLHNLVGLLSHLLIHILTLFVILVDVVRLGQRLLKVTFYEKVHCLCSVLHSS